MDKWPAWLTTLIHVASTKDSSMAESEKCVWQVFDDEKSPSIALSGYDTDKPSLQ